MSDEIGRMSAEDRFLGVATTVDIPEKGSTPAEVNEIDVDVIDDDVVYSRPADVQLQRLCLR